MLSNPVNWGLIGTLVILEGLLSANNALLLAVIVKGTSWNPENQQKKALFYGLLGDYVFWFIAIGLGMFLIKHLWIKTLSEGYLAWILLG